MDPLPPPSPRGVHSHDAAPSCTLSLFDRAHPHKVHSALGGPTGEANSDRKFPRELDEAANAYLQVQAHGGRRISADLMCPVSKQKAMSRMFLLRNPSARKPVQSRNGR